MNKFLTIAAAALLLGACASDKGDTTGTGDNNQGGNMGSGSYQAGSVEEFNNAVGNTVHFGYDRYDVESEAAATLKAQADWLAKYPNGTVTVEGHCDERGTREYNLALGERRANAVRRFLVANGVAADRIKIVSYGKERPAVDGHDEGTWAQNRRGVTVVMQ